MGTQPLAQRADRLAVDRAAFLEREAAGFFRRANDARAFMDLDGMKLGVRRGSRVIEFAAQYVGHRPDGTLGYFSEVGPACIGFVGWLPYPVQRWDLSTSKLAFKDAMRGAGVRPSCTMTARPMRTATCTSATR